MVITHAEHPALGYSVSQQIEAAQMGAWIEHSYNNIWFKRASLNEVYSQICAVGYEHIILSSDLGQPDAPYCDEGMEAFAAALHQKGIPSEELRPNDVQQSRTADFLVRRSTPSPGAAALTINKS